MDIFKQENIAFSDSVLKTIPAISCIYFLFHGENIIYIGSTCNLYQRVIQHKKTKLFDGVNYIYVEKLTQETLKLEKDYIEKFTPKYNIYKSNFAKHNPIKDCTAFMMLNLPTRYKIIYKYREKLMKYPSSLRPQTATKLTAEHFGITTMTVYNAVKENRKDAK